jgi:hypothetical protein
VFRIEHYFFRSTAVGLRMFQAAAYPRFPFCDNRMVDFFCGLPSDYMFARRLQIDYLRRHAPELARIEWQGYDANLFNYQHFHTWHLPKRAAKRALRTLTRRRAVAENWQVQLLGAQESSRLEALLLRPGHPLHEFVDPARVQELLLSFRRSAPGDGTAYTVCMLLTFAASLERYG